jgi:hypothetical protein
MKIITFNLEKNQIGQTQILSVFILIFFFFCNGSSHTFLFQIENRYKSLFCRIIMNVFCSYIRIITDYYYN